nr:unnamed protein product [Callosobruchus chinensis]
MEKHVTPRKQMDIEEAPGMTSSYFTKLLLTGYQLDLSLIDASPLPHGTEYEVLSTGSELLVEFVANSDRPGRGFRAKYQFQPAIDDTSVESMDCPDCRNHKQSCGRCSILDLSEIAPLE